MVSGGWRRLIEAALIEEGKQQQLQQYREAVTAAATACRISMWCAGIVLLHMLLLTAALM
jgi:hypothetical protein